MKTNLRNSYPQFRENLYNGIMFEFLFTIIMGAIGFLVLLPPGVWLAAGIIVVWWADRDHKRELKRKKKLTF